MSRYTRGYGLSLRDGQNWWITAVGDNIRYADKLAAMMELRTCALNGSAKFIYSDTGNASYVKNELDASMSSKRPQRGSAEKWAAHDHKTVWIWRHNCISDVVCEIRSDAKEYITLYHSIQPILQQGIALGGLPFHAALAELDGRGVLLAAPSGTGKSTCSCRLPDYWKSLCDDEALVVLDEQNRYRVHPFPTWSEYLLEPSEKTWNVQYSVPVSAVFFLEQAENDKAVPIGEGRAAVLMTQSADHVCRKFWRNADALDERRIMEKLFDNACKIARQTPVFRLRVNLRGRFWEEIEKVLE